MYFCCLSSFSAGPCYSLFKTCSIFDFKCNCSPCIRDVSSQLLSVFNLANLCFSRICHNLNRVYCNSILYTSSRVCSPPSRLSIWQASFHPHLIHLYHLIHLNLCLLWIFLDFLFTTFVCHSGRCVLSCITLIRIPLQMAYTYQKVCTQQVSTTEK